MGGRRGRVRVFVTQPVPGAALDRLRNAAEVAVYEDWERPVPREVLLEEAGRSDVLWCLLHDRIDGEVIERSRCRLIAVTTSGVNVDVAAATRRGIVVATVPYLVAEATADLQWALLLAVARRVVEADRALRTGMFPGAQSQRFVGGEVHGKTLGTIGLGASDGRRCTGRGALGCGWCTRSGNGFPWRRRRRWGCSTGRCRSS